MPVSVGYPFGWLCWTCLSVKSRSSDWPAQTKAELFLKELLQRHWICTTPQPQSHLLHWMRRPQAQVGFAELSSIILQYLLFQHGTKTIWKVIFLTDRITNYSWNPWLLETARPLTDSRSQENCICEVVCVISDTAKHHVIWPLRDSSSAVSVPFDFFSYFHCSK